MLLWEAMERQGGDGASELTQSDKHLHFDTWADAQQYLVDRAKQKIEHGQ